MIKTASDTLRRSLASASMIINNIHQFEGEFVDGGAHRLACDIDTPHSLMLVCQRSYAAAATVAMGTDDVLDRLAITGLAPRFIS